nr:unnamed protein product [Mus musculus]
MGTAWEGDSTSTLPSLVDTEDSFDEGPGALVLESDLLLGQDLEFEEEEEEDEGDGHNDQLMGFERDSEGDSQGARPGLPYGLSDDESGGGRALSAESEVEEPARGPGEASGEKPFRCARCPYASAHLDNLKRHQRVHTGEKPYKCPLCPYACGNLANLKRHGRIHSGDKPFRCSLCNYSCNQSMNLKRHMLRHTGEKPFRCATCAYTTGHWDNYKRHQKVHGHGGAGGPGRSAPEGWAPPHSPPSVLSTRGPAALGATGSRALHSDSP